VEPSPPADATAVETLLAKLVAAPSPNPPGDERAVAAVVRAEADRLALPRPRTHARDPRRPNLVFELGDGDGPRLLLGAHMDTMPPGDRAAWSSDPYVLTRDGARLVGLGVADMKGSIAALLIAAARIAARPPEQGTLVLALTADEEAGSADGMAWLADEGLLSADAAVMLEPSSLGAGSFERLFVAQRGSCVASLVARGRPGHSAADVPRGERAGAALAAGMTALLERDLFPGLRHPIDGTTPLVNVATMVAGGEVPFAHPPELRATIEVRTIAGQTRDGVLAALRGALADAGLAARVAVEPAAPPQDWIPGGDDVTDARLLAAARAGWRAATGADPQPAVLPATTDSAHLQAIGIPSLPTFGPGSLAVAHQPDEWLLADDLARAVDAIETLARAYLCGDREEPA
jgi:acetylornithine deacetylase/succinyl-diaminopimelate desuccinylase-like protein